MQDLRKLLIGTWKSDKRLTLENCHRFIASLVQRNVGSAQYLASSFFVTPPGRLHHSLRGTEWISKYDVVAVDSESIVVRIHSDDLWKRADPLTADIVKEMAEPRLQHLHFRRRNGRQYYWLGCGILCEWFRRQDIQPSRSRPRGARARIRNRTPSAQRAT